MANALYPKWKEALLEGDANSTLTEVGLSGLHAVLLNEEYVYDPTHVYFSEVPLPGRASDTFEVEAVTVTNGIVNGNDVTFLSVLSGLIIRSIVLFRKNIGPESTWRLVCFLNENVRGLPAVPNGNDIIINWHPTGIFRL